MDWSLSRSMGRRSWHGLTDSASGAYHRRARFSGHNGVAMKALRLSLFLSLALVAAGCGRTQIEQPCQHNSDCENGLVCGPEFVCVAPGDGSVVIGCDPPCKANEMCVDNRCLPVT